jgi:ElaB/YqjD/DUF883 family membrane-anchored ribosome-binding protein
MRTQDLPQTQRPARSVEQTAERNPARASSTRHAQWDELHGTGNGGARHLLTTLRQEISRRPWTDMAVAAAAGFAAGWLISSRQRSHAMRDLFISSLLPAASKKFHHAYDSLRGNDALRELGHQFGKLKSRW